MKKFAVSLILLASVSANAQTVLPTYAPNKPLTATVYGTSDSGSMTMSATAFLSDGSYCSVMAGVGALASLTGKWQQKGNHIEITIDPIVPNVNGVWEHRTGTTPNVLISDWLVASFSAPFLVGFGNKTPANLSIYDPKKGESTLSIPKGATHFFVGTYEQGATKHNLTRFSLDYAHLPAPEKGETFQLQAIAFPNMLVGAEKHMSLTYKIEKGQLFGKSSMFGIDDGFSSVGDGQKITDPEQIKTLRQECTLDPAAESDSEEYAFAKKDSIEWQGTITP